MNNSQKELKKLLTKERFSDWLDSAVEKRDYVGYTRSPGNCPIATYLRDCGMSWVSVRTTHAYGSLGRCSLRDCIELPEWASKFVTLTDNRGYGKKITTRMAKNTLKKV